MGIPGNIQQAMTYERRNGNSEAIVELWRKCWTTRRTTSSKTRFTTHWVRWRWRTGEGMSRLGCLSNRWLAHVDNDRQLGKGYLKLADLYMEDLEYPTAQAYYDSALVYMEEDNERKEEVSSLASDLTSLVDNLNVIAEVDSMLNICDMDEDMRLRVVDRILREMELDLERQREEQEAQGEPRRLRRQRT